MGKFEVEILPFLDRSLMLMASQARISLQSEFRDREKTKTQKEPQRLKKEEKRKKG